MSNPKPATVKPRRIGVDVDGVLNSLQEEWLDWINLRHDPNFLWEQWTTFSVETLTAGGMSVLSYLNEPGAFRNSKPQPDAQRVTRLLVEAGHAVYPVTACAHLSTFYGSALIEKVAWLQEHFPHIECENYAFVTRKHLLNLDYLIDDGLHNFVGFQGVPIVFDHPWNRDSTIRDRAFGWAGAERLLTVHGVL